jgi:hypothetical protein
VHFTAADLATLTECVRRRVVRGFRMQRLIAAGRVAADGPTRIGLQGFCTEKTQGHGLMDDFSVSVSLDADDEPPARQQR